VVGRIQDMECDDMETYINRQLNAKPRSIVFFRRIRSPSFAGWGIPHPWQISQNSSDFRRVWWFGANCDADDSDDDRDADADADNDSGAEADDVVSALSGSGHSTCPSLCWLF
jgi:hypothetical protein